MHAKLLELNLDQTAQYIVSLQQTDGAILWCPNQKLDPWDHVEAAMGLSVAGYSTAAEQAYAWLKHHQKADGSWNAAYFLSDSASAGVEIEVEADDAKNNALTETNFVAYIATGIWHHYRITKNIDFLHDYFLCVANAINYVLRFQSDEGDIAWAVNSQGEPENDALLTACASIARSLECAILLAEEITQGSGKNDSTNASSTSFGNSISTSSDAACNTTRYTTIKTANNVIESWRASYQKLATAVTSKPERFDRTWESKQRFAMDWYYPVLAGLYPTAAASLRLKKRWQEFVEPELGCRCVSDEPWVTMAETSELVIALIAANEPTMAATLFKTLPQWQQNDGGFVTGYVFRDKTIWPDDKTSWTAGAVLLAADALYQLTPANDIFTQPSRLIEPLATLS